ncbi:MAG: hypothetical protein KJO34_10270, partial [Deltaproteobacteria bacterium]|nr:hypothetical protein [Deltaproteobacteria bacterium]
AVPPWRDYETVNYPSFFPFITSHRIPTSDDRLINYQHFELPVPQPGMARFAIIATLQLSI